MKWVWRGIHRNQGTHMAAITLLVAIAGGWRGFLMGIAFCAFGWALSCLDY